MLEIRDLFRYCRMFGDCWMTWGWFLEDFEWNLRNFPFDFLRFSEWANARELWGNAVAKRKWLSERSSRAQASERSDRRVRMFAQTVASQRAERHNQRLGEVRDVCEIKRASRSLTETGFSGVIFWSFFCRCFKLIFARILGVILEWFWSSKPMQNPSKIRSIFLVIFECFSGGFLGSFLEGFLMKSL